MINISCYGPFTWSDYAARASQYIESLYYYVTTHRPLTDLPHSKLKNYHNRLVFKQKAASKIGRYLGLQSLDRFSANLNTLAKYRFDKLSCKHLAIWPENTKLRITHKHGIFKPGSYNYYAGYSTKEISEDCHRSATSAKEEIVATITIPECMTMKGWTEIDILKIDIEGAEYELFDESSHKWLPCVKCIVVECPDADRPLTTQKIFSRYRELQIDVNTYISGENLILIRNDVNWECKEVIGFR